MKRIVDGLVYNTANSVKVAQKRERPSDTGSEACFERLYKTPSGAFFLVVDMKSVAAQKWYMCDEIIAMDNVAAREWASEGVIELFGDALGEFEEA